MTHYFDLTSFVAGILCIQTLFQLFHNWSKFWDSEVTIKDRELTQRLALFVLIPIGVLFHEIGHSLATWQVGGTVSEFQWRFYWGYIIPSGDFSDVEYWWIALSGNLVSIVLGLLPIPFLLYIRKRIVGEVLYNFACVELIYALIGYPLLSSVIRTGDWVKIYNFLIKPYAQITLVAHITLLWGLWTLFHSETAIRWRLARKINTLKKWQKLKQDLSHKSDDLQAHLKLAHFLLEQNEVHEAKKLAKKIALIAPHDNQVKLLGVRIDCFSSSYRKAIQSARQLLNTNLSTEDRVRLYQILCFCLRETKQLQEALFYANQGLSLAPQDYKLRFYRAIVYQMLGQYQEAKADLDMALNNAPDTDSRLKVQQFMKIRSKT